MDTRSLIYLALTGLFFVAGCAGSRDAKTSDRPDSFRLSIAKGGGFAGLYVGHDIFEDGRIERWRGVIKPDSAAVVGQLTPSALDSVWALVKSAELIGRESAGPGNLSGTVELVLPDTTVSLTWPASMPPQPADEPLEAFYRDVLSLISRYIDD